MTLMHQFNVDGSSGRTEENVIANAVPLTEERLAILGHELRNPLHALRFAIEVLSSSKDEPHLLDELIQVMHRQVAQLTRLCDDLLDTGRMTRGSLTVERKEIEISQLILHAREQIQPFIERCGHTLDLKLSDTPLMLLGDASRLTQVFANLMHNAAKFTDRNGQICISLSRENDSAVICFRDNGRGMDAAQLRTLFTSDNISKPCSEVTRSGLGIGLRLAKSIIELHGGSIEAFSDGLGAGSAFVVKIPVMTDVGADAKGGAAECQSSQLPSTQQPPPMQILVVDDDRSIRVLMSRVLQDLNQSVTVADNGETALQRIFEDRPHVVFIDLQMHGMTGLEIATSVRGHCDLDGVVLIALSGSTDSASRRLAAVAGFDQFLPKPASSAALARILHQVGAS